MNKVKKKIKKNKRTIAGALWLFIVGVAFILYPSVSEASYKLRAQSEIEQFQASYVSNAVEADLTKVIYPELYQAFENYNGEILNNRQVSLGPTTSESFPLELTDYGVNTEAIGFLSIPDISIQLPLFLGADEQHLIDGAAVMGYTSAPIGGTGTNCAILGHNYCYGAKRFVYLSDLEKGDEVIVTTFWGSRTYKVESTAKVKDNNYDALRIQEGKDMITLMTCYKEGGEKLRFLVYCVYDGQ